MTQRPGDDGLVQTQHDELDRLLDALGQAEPPADFLEDVMRQVKARPRLRGRWDISSRT